MKSSRVMSSGYYPLKIPPLDLCWETKGSKSGFSFCGPSCFIPAPDETKRDRGLEGGGNSCEKSLMSALLSLILSVPHCMKWGKDPLMRGGEYLFIMKSP